MAWRERAGRGLHFVIRAGMGAMADVAIGLFGFLTVFVLLSLQRNEIAGVDNPPILTAMGWGLFSTSTMLAALLTLWALAMAFGGGINPPG